MRWMLTATLALMLIGCQRQPPVSQVWVTATSPSGGRAPAAGQLIARWNAGERILDQAIDLAFEQLDSVKSGKPPPSTRVVPKSMDATAFAGAVLDAVEALTPKLPMDAEHEFLWMRVGGLACAAADEALTNGRLAEARSLVFAGGTRWQNEGYWMTHPSHDGLASVILAATGERAEAIRRLEDRGDLTGLAAEVLAKLKAGQ